MKTSPHRLLILAESDGRRESLLDFVRPELSSVRPELVEGRPPASAASARTVLRASWACALACV
ncbi:MAG: hypothetical protein ACKODC_11085 [Limnohabitans sp.]